MHRPSSALIVDQVCTHAVFIKEFPSGTVHMVLLLLKVFLAPAHLLATAHTHMVKLNVRSQNIL